MSTVIELNGTHSSQGGPSGNAGNNIASGNVQASSSNQQNTEFSSQAVLLRMKELEQKIQELNGTVSTLESDNNQKEHMIKKLEQDKDELSAERKKEMEQILETAINDWLNSLSGISEEVRQQFKNGITGLAKKADIRNHAWEVVCNASKAHKENVAKIEELVRVCNEKEKTIETLLQSNNDPSFKSSSSRMAPVASSADTAVISNPLKRMRADDSHHANDVMDRGEPGKTQQNHDAWDHFASMIKDQSRGTYF